MNFSAEGIEEALEAFDAEMRVHLDRARWRLEAYPDEFLGVDLRSSVQREFESLSLCMQHVKAKKIAGLLALIALTVVVVALGVFAVTVDDGPSRWIWLCSTGTATVFNVRALYFYISGLRFWWGIERRIDGIRDSYMRLVDEYEKELRWRRSCRN